MELSKNIFFNTDKLVENQTVKITYTGKFFQENSPEIYLHYGFGMQWENLGHVLMERTEIGYQAEITLTDAETLNFCFKDVSGEWDNNNGANYIFPIEKYDAETVNPELALIVAPTRKLRKTYLWSKKIKLAVYKIITYLPRLISGNYRRKIKNNDAE